MKLKRMKRIILTLITILVLGSTTANGVEYYCNVTKPYYWESDSYCSEAGKPLWYVWPQTGRKSTFIDYAFSNQGNVEIEPSTGYAFYVAEKEGIKQSDLQTVIYHSDRWGNSTNVKDSDGTETLTTGKIYQRATQYGNAYYGVLQDAITNNKEVLKVVSASTTEKVLVDRPNGEYMIGPYKLQLNTSDNSYKTTGAQNLYNEIIKTGNSGFSTATAFATFDINQDVTGVNGTNLRFVNTNGNTITFPNFVPGSEQEFYIRFKPNYNGAITTTGNPQIKIHYLKSFIGNLQKGTPEQIIFSIYDPGTPTPGTPTPGTPGTPDPANPGNPPTDTIPVNFKTGKIVGVEKYGGGLTEYKKEYKVYLTGSFWAYTDGTRYNGERYTNPNGDTVDSKGNKLIWYTPDEDPKLIGEEIEVNFRYRIIVEKDVNIGAGTVTHQQVFSVRTSDFKARHGTTEDIYLDASNEAEYNQFMEYEDKTEEITNWILEKSMNEYNKTLTMGYNENEYDDADGFTIEPEFPSSWTIKHKAGNVYVIGKTVRGELQNSSNKPSIIKTMYEKFKGFINPYNSKNTKLGLNQSNARDVQFKKVLDYWGAGFGPPGSDNTNTNPTTDTPKIDFDSVDNYEDTTYSVGDSDAVDSIQKIIRITGNHVDPAWAESTVKLNGHPLNMQIGGTAWLEKETDGIKTNGEGGFAGIEVQLYEYTQQTENNYNSSNITLTNLGNNLVATTTTDKNGRYRFFGKKILSDHAELLINPLKRYYVVFTYDGQRYESTYYNNNLTAAGYSNAKEKAKGRDDLDLRFTNIYSDADNYQNGAWHKAYALDQKIEKANGDFISYDGRALTYQDVYNEFIKRATIDDNKTHGNIGANDYNIKWDYNKAGNSTNNVYDLLLSNNGALRKWLEELEVSDSENVAIRNYIKDTFISSTTRPERQDLVLNSLFPRFDKFVIENIDDTSTEYRSKTTKTMSVGSTYTYLYSANYDMARYNNLGLFRRPSNDLKLEKDVFKTTLIVNGKKEEYDHYKGHSTEIGIRASDYLYDGATFGENSAKNIQAFVTYRIKITNAGDVNARINEIVDYYDATTYEFDSAGYNESNATYTNKTRKYNLEEMQHNKKWKGQDGDSYVSSYIGSDENGRKLADVVVKNKGIPNTERGTKTIIGGNYNYSSIYLTGINSTGIKSTNGDDILKPKDVAYVYVTFKVKNDETNNNDVIKNKVKLDQNLTSGEIGIGKRNIAEINAYSTFYADGNKNLPNYLSYNSQTKQYERITKKRENAGLIDKNSNPGNLKARDLDSNGDIITNNSEVQNRKEDDTGKAENIKLTIKDGGDDDNDIRTIRGTVFEDERTNESKNAIIGDGKFDVEETPIDGVTVQLVELVKNVDADGIFDGTYSHERVWTSYQYDKEFKLYQTGEEMTYPDTDNQKLVTEGIMNDFRYASGSGSSKIIINGPSGTLLHVNNTNLGKGEYAFKSIPSGDFFVRFIYGDTDDTLLVNTEYLKDQISSLPGQIENASDSKEKNRLQMLLKKYQENLDLNYLISNVDEDRGTVRTGKNNKSYNGQDYKSTIYQTGITQNTMYNGIEGYKNYDSQNYEILRNEENHPTSPIQTNAVRKDAMYYYDISAKNDSGRVSDAKDVLYYRERTNNYSKGANGTTLLNNRAETLASFERIATYLPYAKDESGKTILDENGDPTPDTELQRQNQIDMLQELRDNTYMVAQTGVINTEMEYNRYKDEGESKSYVISNVNLGLTERPETQLRLTKEIVSVGITLANGDVLYDTEKSVSNFFFSTHQEHSVYYGGKNNKRMLSFEINGDNLKNKPEILQTYLDDEIIKGATIFTKYRLTVENLGEVDYADNQFYYTGEENDENTNIVKTNAKLVVDYVSNAIKFDPNSQDPNTKWMITSAGELVKSNDETRDFNNDYINRMYKEELKTYNAIITSNELEGELVPQIVGGDSERRETTLCLSTSLAGNNGVDNLVFNNLSEIIAVSNTVGRRNQYSIVGNEEPPDQSLGNNAASGTRNSLDRVKPSEIDADSAQRIVIMPPTGIQNNTIIIIASIIAISIIGIATLAIKKIIDKKK